MRKVFVAGAIAVISVLLLGVGISREEGQAMPALHDGSGVVRHGEMTVPRAAHQATAMAANRILITGGCRAHGCVEILASAEIYDHAARSFVPVAAMATPRVSHVAAALSNSRVLIASGWTGTHSTATAEIYDSARQRFTPAGEMAEARMGATAVRLRDGRVLIVGGEVMTGAPLASAELFDPGTDSFSTTGAMRTARAAHAAVALADGRVLVTGGNRGRGELLRSAEIFDPVTGEFLPTGELRVPRHKHAAVLLADGRVLIIGGSGVSDRGALFASTEYFDPVRGEFSPGPELRSARYKLRDAAVALPSGAVLAVGGAARPEWWDPTDRVFRRVNGELSGPRMFASATLLPDGDLLLLGGYDDQIRPSASAWRVRIED